MSNLAQDRSLRRRLALLTGGAVAAVMAVVAVACGGGDGGGGGGGGDGALPDVESVAQELADFGELAEVRSQPVSETFGPEGGALPLDDGARIEVPAGAFQEPTEVSVAIVKLALHLLSPNVSEAAAYVVSTEEEIGRLEAPVILELPERPEEILVQELVDGEWEPRVVAPGPTTRIEISHFSKNIITAIGAAVEYTEQQVYVTYTEVYEELLGSDELAHRQRIELDPETDEWTQAFYGVGESASGRSHDAICNELLGVLADYNDPSNYEFPADYPSFYPFSGRTYGSLGTFLFAAKPPEAAGGYFWESVAESQTEIEERILGHDPQAGRLSPADVLRIAIEANEGNVALGVLAAHNYLKQNAYAGREMADPDAGNFLVNETIGMVASRLEPWRKEATWNPAGRLDKMGPLYHIFAAMTAGVWGPHPLSADAAAAGEALLRSTPFIRGSDVPDREKGLADECGADVADAFVEQTGRVDAAAVQEDGDEPTQPQPVIQSVFVASSLARQFAEDEEFKDAVYNAATVTVEIDPAVTSWIAWNNASDLASGPSGPILGPGGFGTDDYVVVAVTSPDGQSRSVRMDGNDAYGRWDGPQNVIYGASGDAPDVSRRYPSFADPPDKQFYIDEAGTHNNVFATAGTYKFEFVFFNAFTRSAGHPDIYLLIEALPQGETGSP